MTGEHMLNIGGLHEGVVLDHIPAGKAMDIYKRLKLDKLDCQVAMIMHARSSKMGQKDIIKVEAPLELLNLDALGFIDHTITVNIIKDAKIVEKRKLRLPRKLVNVIHCNNPRCSRSDTSCPYHTISRMRSKNCTAVSTARRSGTAQRSVDNTIRFILKAWIYRYQILVSTPNIIPGLL